MFGFNSCRFEAHYFRSLSRILDARHQERAALKLSSVNESKRFINLNVVQLILQKVGATLESLNGFSNRLRGVNEWHACSGFDGWFVFRAAG